MNRLYVVAVCLAVPFAAFSDEPAANADSHEKVIRDMLKTMREVTKSFEGVKDEESAKKAKPGLEKLAAEVRDITARIKKLGTPTKAQEADLDKKFKQEVESTLTSYLEQYQRLSKESYGKDLATIIERTQQNKPAAGNPSK